jgi:hypothetical protein
MGPPGTGKSTFARGAPDPIVICADPHEAADMPADVPNMTPVAWDDPDDGPFNPERPSMLGFLRMLANEEHGFKSVVVDTFTGAQRFCEAQVCAALGFPTIADVPFGKGPGHLANAWRALDALLESCNKRGLNVIRVAHVDVKRWKNPDGGDWDQWVAQLNPAIASLATQGASNVLFTLPEMHAAKIGGKKTGDEKTIGVTTGKVVLRTSYSATVAAKERLFLPDEMEVSWAAFQIAAQEGRVIRTELNRALRSLGLRPQAAAEKYLSDNRYSRESALEVIAQSKKIKKKTDNGTQNSNPQNNNETTKENAAS